MSEMMMRISDVVPKSMNEIFKIERYNKDKMISY